MKIGDGIKCMATTLFVYQVMRRQLLEDTSQEVLAHMTRITHEYVE